MAKSLRAKAKKASRAVKRSDSFYAREEAARTARLHEKLMSKLKPDDDEDKVKIEDDAAVTGGAATASQDAVDAIVEEEDGDDEEMSGDESKPSAAATTKISTSGPRNSRRETWRVSKGMSIRPKRETNNRQLMTKGKRKAGRPSRRR